MISNHIRTYSQDRYKSSDHHPQIILLHYLEDGKRLYYPFLGKKDSRRFVLPFTQHSSRWGSRLAGAPGQAPPSSGQLWRRQPPTARRWPPPIATAPAPQSHTRTHSGWPTVRQSSPLVARPRLGFGARLLRARRRPPLSTSRDADVLHRLMAPLG